MAGFAQGGGVGLVLAQWITQGEPDADVYAMDVGRFGPYASRNYTIAKAREFYSRRFQIAYPNEYWPAGRPSKRSPIYSTLKMANAVFGVSYGQEVPLYFARAGELAVETPSLRRSNAFESVRDECHAARRVVALLDISSFAKYLISGPNAERALNRVLAGRLPAIGCIRLTPMLAHSGRLMGDLTTMRLAVDQFLICGSGYLQSWHMRWFAEHLEQVGVQIRNASDEYGGLALFGPRSRELLARVASADVSNAALPFFGIVRMDLAFAPALIARLSVSGELGYEIYVPMPYLSALFDAILQASPGLAVQHAGIYALNSLRLEKGFGIWSREFSRDYTPRMSGLDRFIDYDRLDFIGRDAALRDRDSVPERRLAVLAVESRDADATGYEPIHLGKDLVGFATSGGYAHCADTSVAMGYLSSSVPAEQDGLSITILGEPCPCRILRQPLIDPSGARMKD
jgi:dimethylglycine dehydrogenase